LKILFFAFDLYFVLNSKQVCSRLKNKLEASHRSAPLCTAQWVMMIIQQFVVTSWKEHSAMMTKMTTTMF
jgi:hypothetical protein